MVIGRSKMHTLNALWQIRSFAILALAITTVATTDGMAQDSKLGSTQVKISLIRQSDIPARDAGTVEAIHFTEGMPVAKGDLLVELESEQQTLRCEAAELALKIAQMRAKDSLPSQTAQAQLNEAEAGRDVTKVTLMIAEAEAKNTSLVGIATAETRLRELELERALSSKKTFDGSVSKSQIDRLQTSVKKGELEIRQAKDDLAVQKLKPQAEAAALEKKQQEITRYQTLLEQETQNQVVADLTARLRQNELRVARANLEYRYIRAPFDGVVAKMEKQLGEWVEPGLPVARIIDVKNLRAEGFLPAAVADQSLVGREVTIQVAVGKSPVDVVGKIAFVGLEVDPQNQQIRFYADFSNADLRVRPGMTGSLTVRK